MRLSGSNSVLISANALPIVGPNCHATHSPQPAHHRARRNRRAHRAPLRFLDARIFAAVAAHVEGSAVMSRRCVRNT
jgi:hypothetical protein